MNHPDIRAFLSQMMEVDMIPDIAYGLSLRDVAKTFCRRNQTRGSTDAGYCTGKLLIRSREMKKENQKVKLSEKIGMLMVCAGNIPLMTPFIRIFYDLLHNCGGTGSRCAGDLVFNL